MWIAIGLIVGVVLAWVLVDRWKTSRDERLHRGPSAWAELGPGRTFHTTGWEETLPPALTPVQNRAKDGGDRTARSAA